MSLLRITALPAHDDQTPVFLRANIACAEDLVQEVRDTLEFVTLQPEAEILVQYYPGATGPSLIMQSGCPATGHLESSGAKVYEATLRAECGAVGILSRSGTFVAFISMAKDGQLRVSEKEV